MSEPSANNPGLTADVLFVGATRPAMRWGATFTGLIANALLTMEAFLLTKDLFALLLAIPLHGLCVLLCARDVRCFELLALALRCKLIQLLASGRRWRTSTFSAIAADLPQSSGRRVAACERAIW